MRSRAVLLALLGACGGTHPLVDLDGRTWEPLQVRDQAAHVILFVTTDCPIANSYAPEIRAIAND